MAMAACGEDEFGNLFADVNGEEVHALRGFGSLQWSLEDESDPSANMLSGEMPLEGPPAASVHGCYANITDISSVQRKGMKDNRAENEKNCKNSIIGAAGIAFGADDLASDSDDDLHIVSQKTVNEGVVDDSEDGEDFVVLTGNGQEWRENSLVPTEDSAQANVVGGEKVGLSADEQAQNQKTFRVHPRICYGGYRRHYRVMFQLGLMRTEFPCCGLVLAADS